MNSVRSVALSQSGECAVVATLERISLLNHSGKEIWHWDFKKGNRFMTASRVAVCWITSSEDLRSIVEWSEDRIAWFVPSK